MSDQSNPISSTSPPTPDRGKAGTSTVVIILVALVIIITVGIVMYRSYAPKPVDKTTPPSPLTKEAGPPTKQDSNTEVMIKEPISTAPVVSAIIKEFTISGQNYSFSPNEMRVKQGDTVRITFQNVGGMHNWRLDEFSASSKVIQTGQTDTVEFVAALAGSYEFYCSVGQHRQLGMVGTLIVE